MALAGNIKEFGLADIFQIVSLQQKTGVLTIEGSQGRVTVLLEKGYIVGADATFRPVEERLSQTLVRSQKISKFQLKRATENQKKTFQPLWSVLAEMGEIDHNTLGNMLSQQIHETVYHVLRWTEGEYRFDPKKNVDYDKRLVSPINTEFLIMEGFRITDEWPEVEKEITSFQLVVRRSATPPASPDALSGAETKVYELLETERTIQEIIDASQLGEFDTCQTVYELMKKNLVEKARSMKGKTTKARMVSFDFRDLFAKAATLIIGIGIVIVVILLFRFLPEDFMLIHKPNAKALSSVKHFSSQSHLNNLSQIIEAFFLENKKFPTSLQELQQQGFISSDKVFTDPWGNEYTIASSKALIILRSPGKDGTPRTEDDVTVEIPL